MQYTFDINITGCNNRCSHCYINGKPSPSMAYADVLFCIDKLKEILDTFDGKKCIYLDCEVFNHPDISEIMCYLYDVAPEYCYFNSNGIPTTGVALLERKDKIKIIETLRYVGCEIFTLTLHGNEAHHSEITQNNRAFKAIANTAKFLTDNGFKLEFNLMLSKYLIEDFKEITKFIDMYPDAYINLTIPDYIPTQRLKGFQKYRAELHDIQKLKNRLTAARINEDNFFSIVEEICESNFKEKLSAQSFSYKLEEEKMPDWAFFNISRDMKLFYGNTGACTKFLGNLKEMSANDYNKISMLPQNYGWSAFYNLDNLPNIEEVLKKAESLETNYVYSNINDCIYSWLDYFGVKSILMEEKN